MTSNDFENLLTAIGPKIARQDTNYRLAIPARERLAVTLRYLASGDSYSSLSYLFKVSKSTISGIIPEVCAALIDELKDNIKHINQQTPPSPRTIYVITATYQRLEQLAELTRLSQTLRLVPALVWILVEDATEKTAAVEKLLLRSGLSFVHLLAPMPEVIKKGVKEKAKRPRGVSNRNRGLKWLRANATSGVFYFADDDNTYDIKLFEEMRDTKKVSMWPVGLLNGGFGTPVVRQGKFEGFYSGWPGRRSFQVDMAGFAVSVEFLLQRPHARMPYKVGYEEDFFLRSLNPLKPSDIQWKATNCTEILVWHTQTKTPSPQRPIDLNLYNGTNIPILFNNL
ncbi:galactosylgalactosylxylosylprotein 3-beta-glucuronosyltransferase P-like [Homalodisca vitripennis]|uniref:galactosylgalactosylxylosylprotein 3-beta-glucuronosyltransferase P-like n=1 Tax=Homalodisca vitripennis TaxID=197043 RepID=UPI001EEAFC03|nr:galactosylgalactosylxylosylprotein 3-beta-glucuronosyltransferase P-like [Homalodisca vitripennis]